MTANDALMNLYKKIPYLHLADTGMGLCFQLRIN